ncbi:class I lanthipeptide [Chitinophaga sp. S165]|uniref:class I lanthipeptide n=1 Tax=Chitinophaga sp. S165 TaxID=2135462 RepID=UPI0011B6EE97|nr:class I lanthipeptide [Chitinophaga sp. S165]
MNPKIKLGKSLQLDKEVISKLQEKQMENIIGGVKTSKDVDSSSGSQCSCRDNSCGTSDPVTTR